MNSLKDKVAVSTDAIYVIFGASGNTGSIIADTLLLRRKKARVVGRHAERVQRFVLSHSLCAGPLSIHTCSGKGELL